MNNYRGTGIVGGGSDYFFVGGNLRVGPVKELFGGKRGGVDTTMTHGTAEIGVPIGAVDAVVPFEKHCEGHVG